MRTSYNVRDLTLLSGKPFYPSICYPRNTKFNRELTTYRLSRNWINLPALVANRLISARS